MNVDEWTFLQYEVPTIKFKLRAEVVVSLKRWDKIVLRGGGDQKDQSEEYYGFKNDLHNRYLFILR
jgi:hypothetical protein